MRKGITLEDFQFPSSWLLHWEVNENQETLFAFILHKHAALYSTCVAGMFSLQLVSRHGVQFQKHSIVTRTPVANGSDWFAWTSEVLIANDHQVSKTNLHLSCSQKENISLEAISNARASFYIWGGTDSSLYATANCFCSNRWCSRSWKCFPLKLKI